MAGKFRNKAKVFCAMSPQKSFQDLTGQTGGVASKRAKRVFVAMSGGVDSSVAAALLKERDYTVVGVHMRCYNVDGCAEQDAEDARRAAEVLGIPFYVFDFEKEYKEKVMEYMIDGYRKGITPNPDVECNREIKFGLFLKKALEMGADFVATGHYVRLVKRRNFVPSTRFARPATRSLVLAGSVAKRRHHAEPTPGVSENKVFSLFTARDSNKDQSYFLWTLTQDQLKHCLFPIGDYLKPEVRVLARKFGLPNAEKKDSQGICFLGKVTLNDFLKDYIPEKLGAVLSTVGAKIGEHRGAYFYTIGQRHLGIKNYELRIKGKNEIKPCYVAEKDIKNNTLVVAEGDDNPALYRKEIELTNVNFINPQYSNILQNVGMSDMEIYARIRYRQPLVSAKLIIHNARYKIHFGQPIRFVAPGQSAVFYSKKGEMLGGGVIA
ncbi:MAG TPA: tRNA 2-thiouridine(34) synthase MnmA [Candidatus Paceibacterota bacterium]